MVNSSPARSHRGDIDGLRGVSVLAVLGFHASLPGLGGGFVGVDVFFVISGYLITGLLINEHQETGRIDLMAFWARRVRRLAPALCLVLSALLAASLILLERVSGETATLARTAIATMLLNANHALMSAASDYFGGKAETNPLLHTWSLSVEEQFYVVWPVAVAAASRLLRLRLPVIGGLTAASFVLACAWSRTDPVAAFYLMPARAFELLAGALLAVALRYRGRATWPGTLLAALGCVLIAASAVWFKGGPGFPGPLALVPVGGSVLLLAAGQAWPENQTSKLLAWGPLAYVGKVSYPLYLWHWPILVVLRSQRLYERSLRLDMAALLVSFLLAVGTYEWVERKVSARLARLRAGRVVFLGFSASILLVGSAALLGAWARFGWGYTAAERRIDDARKGSPNKSCLFISKWSSDSCFPREAGPTVLLWGDSHANHWRPALDAVGRAVGAKVATLSMAGCRPSLGASEKASCSAFNDAIAGNLSAWKQDKQLKGLVLSARWAEGTGAVARTVFAGTEPEVHELAAFESNVRSLIDAVRRQQLRTLLVLSSPIQRHPVPLCLSRKADAECFVSLADTLRYVEPTDVALRRIADSYPDVRVLDPKTFMCSGALCPAVIRGAVAYTDDDHVNAQFAAMQANQFESDVRWVIGGPGDAARP